VMVNTGSGCAANVRGTTITARDQAMTQQTGSAGWSYGAIVRPGEQFTYQVNPWGVPTSGDFFWGPTAPWDDVRCEAAGSSSLLWSRHHAGFVCSASWMSCLEGVIIDALAGPAVRGLLRQGDASHDRALTEDIAV